ncbi:MAG: hypothetical protein H6687_01220 [Bacillales bacterium]|nr:hypothetical protein [Bacillales bacterium]
MNKIKSALYLIFILTCALALSACTSKTPKYTGMTVSDSLSGALETSSESSSKIKGINKNIFVADEETPTVPGDDNPDNDFDGNATDVIIPSISVDTTDDVSYYANLNEDIYITVHINNPENYVILRFTLNGTVYQSYQFEDGSDSENLVLKVNSGSNCGIAEYTIDSIKYIDDSDNETKDVDMTDGNQTVKVGIEYDHVPFVSVSDITIGTSSFSASVFVTDVYDIVDYENSKINLYLYDGESVVNTIALVKGENTINIDSLEMGKKYEYCIISVYDKLDGNGEQKVVLKDNYFTTSDAYKLLDVTSDKTSISFDYSKEGDLGSLVSVYLLKDGEVVQEIADDSKVFNSLLSNNEYELRLYYDYSIGETSYTQYVSCEISTLSKIAPTLSVSVSDETQTSFKYTVSRTDPDSILSISKIELLHEGDEAVSLDQSTSLVSSLLSNNSYTVKITYTYDLNDGEGVHTETETISSTI